MSEHKPHPHTPRNVNVLHKTEQAEASLNQKVAVGMTKLFSSMWTFWVIIWWIGLWIVEGFAVPSFPDKMPWPMLLALASVPQLPLMIVIMVGQGVLGRHQELQANEQFKTTQKIYTDIETMIKQNNEILARLNLTPDQAIAHILRDINVAIGRCTTLEEAQEAVRILVLGSSEGINEQATQ